MLDVGGPGGKKKMLSEEDKGNCRCRSSERKDVFKDQKRTEGTGSRRNWRGKQRLGCRGSSGT